MKAMVIWSAGMAASLALFAAGCAQTPQVAEEYHPEFRRSVETAPADLQLACASEAAEQYELAAARVLPLASRVEEAGIYSVTLNIDGARTVCTIDDDGNVLALEEA